MVRPMNASLDFSDAAAVEKFNSLGFGEIAGHFMQVQRWPSAGWAAGGGTVELGPDGIVSWTDDRSQPGMHIAFAGTPHRPPHGFGYWHINDVDEIYLWVPGPDDLTTFVVLERDRGPTDCDQFAWYCHNCLNLLHSIVYESGNYPELGFPGWVEAEGKAVQKFNADVMLRTCTECGAEHPLAYRLIGLPPHSDAEEEARRIW